MIYYPKGTESIIDSFEGEFSSCFILFHPFLKFSNDSGSKDRVSSSHKNEIPEDLKALFKDIKIPSNATIYAANPNYPNEKEIVENGKPVSWKEILNLSDKLNSYDDIQKGLKTSIGAYRKILQRKDLMNAVKEVLDGHKYWSPKEDDINTLTKLLLLKIFNFLSINSVINLDYSNESEPISIVDLDEFSFCKTFNSSVIYSADKEILISQARDTFFCLLLTKQQVTMHKLISKFQPEGILCDNSTCLPWEFNKDEFKALLASEKKNRNGMKGNKSKGWLSRIFGK